MNYIKKIILSLFFSNLLSVACGQTFTSQDGNFELIKTHEFILQENLELYNFSMGIYFNEDRILLSTNTPSVVISYNFEGEQTNIITKTGRGPGELLGPSAIANKKGNFLVWDAMQLKFVELTPSGDYIREYIGVKRALGKFVTSSDKLIIYSYGSAEGGLVSIFNINGSNLERQKSIDSITERHSKLTALRYTNPFDAKDQVVYYGRADTPKIFLYDLISEHKDSIDINDGSFNVEKTNFSMNDRSEKAEIDWQNFIFTNSRFKNIYALDEYLLAEIQNGNNFDRTRENVFHIYDYQMNKIDQIKLNHEDMLEYGSGAKHGNGNKLLFLNDYPDMTNSSGEFIPDRAMEYKRGENHNKKVTIFELKRVN